jgi:hypothetical protein
MTNTNVVKCDFKNAKLEKDLAANHNESSPPTTGVRITMTRKHGNLRVITNLTNLSELDLIWALIGNAAHTLNKRDAVMDEKEEIIRDYITQ